MGVCYTSQALLSSAQRRAASDHQLVQMQNLGTHDGERKGHFHKGVRLEKTEYYGRLVWH